MVAKYEAEQKNIRQLYKGTAVSAKKFSLEKCDESRGFLPCDAANPSHGVCEAARQERSHSTSFLERKFLAGAADKAKDFVTYTLELLTELPDAEKEK